MSGWRAQQGWSSVQAPAQMVAGKQLTGLLPKHQRGLAAWRMADQVSAMLLSVQKHCAFLTQRPDVKCHC